VGCPTARPSRNGTQKCTGCTALHLHQANCVWTGPSDYEMQRAANIARNEDLLRQLGLASPIAT
jgi:hypothetical protein